MSILNKKIMLVIMLVFCIGLISSATWDDRVNYDAQKREYTIINTFGLGSEIGKIRLDTPQVYKVAMGYNKVAEMTLTNGKDWEEVLSGIELFYINDDGSYTKFDRQIDYKIQVPYDKPLYETQCQTQNTNGTPININCKEVQIGTIPSTKWIDFNNALKKNQKATIGLFTNVQVGDHVEWIPTMYGHYLDEWAFWSASLKVDLLAYWELEETSGDAIDSHNGFNGTINTSIGYGATGIINNAYDFDRAEGNYINLGRVLNLSQNHNFSIQAWVYANLTVGAEMIFTTGSGVNPMWGAQLYLHGNGNLYFGSNGGTIYNDTNYLLNQTWIHLVGVYTTNGTGYLYVNGSRVEHTGSFLNIFPNVHNSTIGASYGGTGLLHNFSGIIDEVAVWNRSLSASEVSDLWNNGAGLYFYQAPVVMLISPTNNDITANRTNIFICNVTSMLPISNLTFYLNGVANETNYSGLNNTNYSFTKTLAYGNYNWTCGAENNESMNKNATDIWNLSIITFLVNSETYNTTTIEGNTEGFIINITGGDTPTANLVYNGTSYTGSINSNDAPYYIISKDISIPLVNADTNATFYWEIIVGGETGNSTSHNQTILNLSIDDCSSYNNVIFNFTLADEGTRDLLNMSNPSINGTIELDLDISSLGSTTPFLEYSHTYTNGSYAPICANVNFTNVTGYRVDLMGGVVTETHVQEFYYIDNGTITETNIPQEITLYDLLLTDSTTFVFTFTDENNLIVEDAIVHVYRNYIGDGIFREIERAREDDNGDTLIHLVEEDVIYYFQVTLDGELLYTSSQYTAKCLEDPCQITLTAGAITDDFIPPDLLPEGTYDLSTVRSTRLVTLAFNLNESALMNLSIFTLSGNQSRDDQVLNSSSLTAESGSFSVYVPTTFGNITYYAVIYHDGDIVTSQFIDLTPSAREMFGVLGVFLALLIIILLGLIGATQGIWSIIFLIIGFILASLLTLLELDYLTLVFYVCLCLIIIYKLQTRKSAS